MFDEAISFTAIFGVFSFGMQFCAFCKILEFTFNITKSVQMRFTNEEFVVLVNRLYDDESRRIIDELAAAETVTILCSALTNPLFEDGRRMLLHQMDRNSATLLSKLEGCFRFVVVNDDTNDPNFRIIMRKGMKFLERWLYYDHTTMFELTMFGLFDSGMLMETVVSRCQFWVGVDREVASSMANILHYYVGVIHEYVADSTTDRGMIVLLYRVFARSCFRSEDDACMKLFCNDVSKLWHMASIPMMADGIRGHMALFWIRLQERIGGLHYYVPIQARLQEYIDHAQDCTSHREDPRYEAKAMLSVHAAILEEECRTARLLAIERNIARYLCKMTVFRQKKEIDRQISEAEMIDPRLARRLRRARVVEQQSRLRGSSEQQEESSRQSRLMFLGRGRVVLEQLLPFLNQTEGSVFHDLEYLRNVSWVSRTFAEIRAALPAPDIAGR